MGRCVLSTEPATSEEQAQEHTSSPGVNEIGVLVTVALGTMLAPLNSTMIAVALPSIMQDFGAPLAEAGWIVTAYLIAMACLQPVAGKLGDRLGRRRMILGGLVYFALVSMGAASATSLSALLFFRIQQAIAAAIALPNGTALLRSIVPEERRGARFGMLGAAVVLAAAAGPPIGGILVQYSDWPSIFYANLLLVVPAFLLGLKVLPPDRISPTDKPFDLVGAVLLLISLFGIAGLLVQSRQAEAFVDPVLGCLLVAGISAAFLIREWRHPDPVIQPRFFLRRSFAAANAGVSLSNLAMYTTFLAIPIMLSTRPEWSAARTGLVLAALWTPTALLAPFGGRLADRWGRRWPTVCGLILFAAGLAPLAWSGASIDLTVLVVSLGTGGIGLGLSSAGMQTAAVESVDADEAGVASGIYSTSRYLGSIVGSSVLAATLQPGVGEGGFATIYLVVFGAACAAVLAALGLHNRPSERISDA